MRKYLARRAVYAVVTLFGVSLSIFIILRILPGDPLVAILGVEGHARMSPADRERIMADLGLSDPLPVQYARWLVDIGAGRLGKSFFRGDTVADLIAHRGPISAEIGVLALIVSWLVGLPVGILSAFKPNSVPDGVARAMSVLFIAIPGLHVDGHDYVDLCLGDTGAMTGYNSWPTGFTSPLLVDAPATYFANTVFIGLPGRPADGKGEIVPIRHVASDCDLETQVNGAPERACRNGTRGAKPCNPWILSP